MGIKQKIYFNTIISILLLGAMFGYIFPKMSKSLVDLQNSHQSQIIKLKQLNEQAKSLSKMNEDLQAVAAMSIKPADFFTSDATLVNEIKTMEEVAAKTKSVMTLSISGTADKALAVSSASGLSQVPYAVTLKTTFPDLIRFIKYMENRYFISPISGLNISGDEDKQGGVSATILSSFYIYKPASTAATPAATDNKPATK